MSLLRSKAAFCGVAGLLPALLAACVGTALPQPPNLDIALPDTHWKSEERAVPTELIADAGAMPANVEVWVWDLDGTSAPIVGMSDALGGFALHVGQTEGIEVRLQVRDGETHGTPVDALLASPLVEARRPTCLEVPIAVSISDERRVRIPIINHCADEVILISLDWRMGTSALALQPPVAGSVRLPRRARFELTIVAPDAESAEDILFVHAQIASAAERYPITVFAAPLN